MTSLKKFTRWYIFNSNSRRSIKRSSCNVTKNEELAVQGANGIYEEEDLKAIANEMKESTEQIDKIGRETEFNGIPLLKGELGTDSSGKEITNLRLQIGANSGQYIDIDMKEINVTVGEESGQLKIVKDNEIFEVEGSGFKIASGLTSKAFNEAISIYDTAVKTVASYRSQLGAYQNRLEHTIKNVDNTAENLTAAKSRIEDADMAIEMSEFVKLNILQQAGTSMLSQANQLPQSVLQLLK